MASRNNTTFSKWAVIGSGEGGGRIASEFFTRQSNPGIEDRILVMNTNRTDIRNTIDRLEGSFDEEKYQDHILRFGEEEGAGNVFADGQSLAEDSFDRILRNVKNSAESVADAFMYITTLGGGTGNGSIPYIIRQMKREDLDIPEYEGWMGSVMHAAIGVWPYEDEPPQQQFNAVCGLSRLLRQPDGSQNADMVLLAANSHIADNEGADGGHDYPNDVVNDRLIEAFDLLISGGRETRGVIDVQDLISVPSQIGAYHFTPAVATDMNANVYELEHMFDRAAENAYAPMDVSTTKTAYAIVRAPRSVADDEITENLVQREFEAWKGKHDIDAPGMSTLSIEESNRSNVDVLLLLGGFDLEPLLSRSWGDYETHRDRLQRGRRLGNASVSAERMDRIEENLEEYRRFLEE